MQLLQFLVADTAAHRRYATRFSIGSQASIDHCTVVSAMAGSLHDDVARKAEMVAQCKQLLPAGVAWSVLPLWRVGIFRGRAEDVAVRVDGARGELELRLARVCIP